MSALRFLAVTLALLATTVSLAADPSGTPVKAADSAAKSPLDGLKYRLIGPFRGGRATGVAGVVGDPNTYYFGAATGGLWKTIDGGTSWKPLWDDFPEAAPAVGAVAVAPSDSKTVYAGTGEINIRGNVATGNGLFKSTDAGKTWHFSGLRDSEVIGRIIVDPSNPNIVLVAALGHTFGDNQERGVFRSTDGGANWNKVLYVDAKTGASDVAFDPNNSKVVYAGMWQAYRKPWIMESGGPGSGLYKSIDGGEHWRRLSGGGLPEGILGRINVAPTPDSKVVYAMIEAKKGGLFRSNDGGATWALVSDKNSIKQRAWYFNTVFADPKDANTVYVLNTSLYHSTDGGKTFKTIKTQHGDNHEMWIDPTNPKRMIEGNDGGASVSVDGGETWTSEMNQPTAQFYHIAADNEFPFRLYGDQQDNSSISIATAGRGGGVGIEDWDPVGGGESGFIIPDPTDANIVYGGGYDAELTRHDRRTGENLQITPWPRNTMGWAAENLKYRFQWTAPIMISKFAPHALYFGAQVLFRSLDQGRSWMVISPDLTRNDKTKQRSSGGPLTKDNTSVETYDTIFAISESPKIKDLIWVGSDDGLVHLTRDGGAHWTNVTPKGMPEFATVQMIEPDPNDPAVAYVAADRHRLDDVKPYAFRTQDYGKSWTPIVEGLAPDAYLHVIRRDPARAGLLYAGTETGIMMSYDDGAHWQSLQLNLPVVPVHDLLVHGDSLAVATHGRAFWIIDDLSPVRQWAPTIPTEPAHLFKPAAANHTVFGGRGGGGLRYFGGANPPGGAVINYTLSAQIGKPRPAKDADKDADKKDKDKDKDKVDPLDQRISLDILDENGKVIRHYPEAEDAKSPGEDEAKSEPEEEEEGGRGSKPVKPPHFAGLNTFVWDLHTDKARAIKNAPLWAGSVAGPKVLPGRYQVRLTVDGNSQTQPLEILPDPRSTVSRDDLEKQFALHSAINALLTEVHDAVLDIRATRVKIMAAKKTASSTKQHAKVAAAADALDGKMTAVEEILIQPRSHASEDALNFPVRLNNMLAALGSLVGSGDAAPTTQDEAMFTELKDEAESALARWRELKTGDVAAFEKLSM
jgi:photosystem II stability/assembly factor-like uncharacterized protein